MSRKENDHEPFRSWKGYSFDMLNEPTDEDLIRGGKRTKLIYLTEVGVKEAKALLEKYQTDNDKRS